MRGVAKVRELVAAGHAYGRLDAAAVAAHSHPLQQVLDHQFRRLAAEHFRGAYKLVMVELTLMATAVVTRTRLRVIRIHTGLASYH